MCICFMSSVFNLGLGLGNAGLDYKTGYRREVH